MSRTRILGICAGGLALIVATLFVGGQTYRVDSYRAVSPDVHRLGDAKCMIHLFESGQIREDSAFLETQRPKDTCCMVTVFAFDPAYSSFRVNHLSIDIDGTNVADLATPPPIDPNDLVFKPYIDREAFRSEFPKEDPRDASFALIPHSTTTPLLARPLNVGSKVRVQLSLDILSADKTVLSTNVQTDFTLAREERRYNWAQMLFVKLFLPRF